MPERSDPREPGNSLLEQFYALGDQSRPEEGRSRDIPTWMRKAGGDSVTNSIAHRRRDDWGRNVRLLGCTGRRRSSYDQDQIHLELRQVCKEIREPLSPSLRGPILDDDVPAFYVTESPQGSQ